MRTVEIFTAGEVSAKLKTNEEKTVTGRGNKEIWESVFACISRQFLEHGPYLTRRYFWRSHDFSLFILNFNSSEKLMISHKHHVTDVSGS